MNTNKYWVVFFHGTKELLRYSLYGESEGEREKTIALLAYEKDIPEEEIGWKIVKGGKR